MDRAINQLIYLIFPLLQQTTAEKPNSTDFQNDSDRSDEIVVCLQTGDNKLWSTA